MSWRPEKSSLGSKLWAEVQTEDGEQSLEAKPGFRGSWRKMLLQSSDGGHYQALGSRRVGWFPLFFDLRPFWTDVACVGYLPAYRCSCSTSLSCLQVHPSFHTCPRSSKSLHRSLCEELSVPVGHRVPCCCCVLCILRLVRAGSWAIPTQAFHSLML